MGRYPPQTHHIDTLLCSSDSVVPNLFYCAPLHPMPVVAMWRGGVLRERDLILRITPALGLSL